MFSKIITIISVAIGFLLTLKTARSIGIISGGSLDNIFNRVGKLTNVEPRLLRAIAMVESNLNVKAINENEGGGRMSFGVMQLLCDMSAEGTVCSNRLPAVDEWPPKEINDLFNPNYNILVAAKILRWNVAGYGLKRGVAMYNNYGARFDPLEGPFRNQRYVDMVFSNYN